MSACAVVPPSRIGAAILLAAFSLAHLTGCSGANGNDATAVNVGDSTANRAAAPAPAKVAPAGRIVLAENGLTIIQGEAGAGTSILFDSDQASATKSITAVFGDPAQSGTNDDCPAGAIQYATWSKGLTVNFQGGKFVGWAGAVDLRTDKGIGFGSSRADLVKAYNPDIQETSLGTEFTAGGISGVLESNAPDAAIGDMWAGVSCVAR